MSSLVGQHIGKYRVTRQVGRGGMGTVYAAVDQTLHRDVALKVLNAGLDDPTVARRFRAEAIAVARLNHPGIATIYELVQHDGQWLMVMEFVRGDTLEEALAGSQRLPVARAAELAMQLLAALVHAHGHGVVHRDLKPANIILSAGGGLKVMDFGIARITGTEQLTNVGFTMGTPAYMAPEQVMGGDIDARTDLYAVGILLFQMVARALPFEGATAVQVAQARLQGSPRRLHDVAPDAPDWLARILDIALARDPADRFQTATLFREAIRRGLAGVPIDGELSPPPASMAIPAMPPTGLHVIKGGAAGPGSAGDLAMLETQMPAPRPVDVPPPAAARRLPSAGPAPAAPAPMPRATTAGPAPVVAAHRPTRRSPLVVATVVTALLVLSVGVWWLTRTPRQDALSLDVAAGAATPPSVGADGPAAPAEPSTDDAMATAATPGTGTASNAARAVDAVRTDAGTDAAGPPAADAPAGAAPSTAAASPANAAADATPAVFRGVRALVLQGQRAEERPAVLTFANGAIRLFDDAGQVAFGEMPYRQITAAAYTRARAPRWYPTLAGPPVDADMPGGLFRGNRHWLALQARASWMIIRMNDNDWQQIVSTVTERLGLKVDTLSPQ